MTFVFCVAVCPILLLFLDFPGASSINCDAGSDGIVGPVEEGYSGKKYNIYMTTKYVTHSSNMQQIYFSSG